MGDSDIFRRFPIRLIGYGYAIGEAVPFRFDTRYKEICETVGFVFMVSHVLFSTYMAAAAMMIKVFLNTLCFELLASAFIPPFVNFYICRWVVRRMHNNEWLPLTLRRWMPVIAGFLTIPFFLLLLDPAVDRLLSMDDNIHHLPQMISNYFWGAIKFVKKLLRLK